jgi:hypothetical protein
MTDLTALSASQLQETVTAVQQELTRRQAQDDAARAEAFRAELAEVREGKRRLDVEHVAYLTPSEVETAVNAGQATHLGIRPDRRLSRR